MTKVEGWEVLTFNQKILSMLSLHHTYLSLYPERWCGECAGWVLPTECRGCCDVTCSASQLPGNPRLSYHHINTRLLKIVILYYVTLAKIYIIRIVAITGDYRKLCTRAATFITVTVTPPVIMIYHYLQNTNSDSSSLIAIQHHLQSWIKTCKLTKK